MAAAPCGANAVIVVVVVMVDVDAVEVVVLATEAVVLVALIVVMGAVVDEVLDTEDVCNADIVLEVELIAIVFVELVAFIAG